MFWQKKSLIFAINNKFEWSKTHTQLPFAILLDDEKIRIYYTTRDEKNRSRSSFIDVDANDPAKVLYIHDKPLLELGDEGNFDDNGVMFSSVIKHQGEFFAYYIGWRPLADGKYDLAIGLAKSNDGINFKRFSNSPILSKTADDLIFVTSPYVMIEDGIFKMWYASCVQWREVNGRNEPVYLPKYATSNDGITWKTSDKIIIPAKFDGEAIGVFSVLKEDKIYKIWYSTRGSNNYRDKAGEAYTIGYAESADGINWQRLDDKAGIEKSSEGWDSEMICYPNVINYKNKKYMFYNGNGFGRNGIGFANLADD
jgi:predicted GH43/DUF377 family glycosyl hydrolase